MQNRGKNWGGIAPEGHLGGGAVGGRCEIKEEEGLRGVRGDAEAGREEEAVLLLGRVGRVGKRVGVGEVGLG